jgi:3-methyl-2-oxobutanoate hydroxymethyltransferase
MSPPPARRTVRDLRRLHQAGEKWVCLTAYAAYTARMLDDIADLILVGDSVGTVVYGYDSTLPVTFDMMAAHGEAVVRAAPRSFVAVDLPFATYQQSKEQAFAAAAEMVRRTGCQAVKMEGGTYLAETIAFVTERGVPVMAHIGMQPQHKNAYGGFLCQGRDGAAADSIRRDAKAVERAGAFCCVLESVPRALADEICAQSGIPVVGIGASPACHGQILVTEDMLGLFPSVPKFVRRYGETGEAMREAIRAYAEDVRKGAFPADGECY